MSITAQNSAEHSYASPDMKQAYDAALESIRRDRNEPQNIQDARRKATLRWLARHR